MLLSFSVRQRSQLHNFQDKMSWKFGKNYNTRLQAKIIFLNKVNQLRRAQCPKGKDRKNPNPLHFLCYHEASWLVSCTQHPHPLALGHLRMPRKPFNGNTQQHITIKYLCQYALAEIFNIFHALIFRQGACCTECQD